MPGNQSHQFFVRFAIHRSRFELCQPGPVARLSEGAHRRIGFHLNLDDPHGALGHCSALSAIATNFSASRNGVPTCFLKRETTPWREISRGRENLGPGFSSSSCGGLHEPFIGDYGVAGAKLKRIYDFSHFFGKAREGGGWNRLGSGPAGIFDARSTLRISLIPKYICS